MIPTQINNAVESNFYSILDSADEEDDISDDDTVHATNVSTNPTTAQTPTVGTPTIPTTIQPKPPLMPSNTPMPTRANAWNTIIQANNLTQSTHSTMIFDTKRVTRAVKYAISDSGATGHFIVEGAPVVNKKPAKNPIQIMMPDGKKIQSTHTCNLDIPWLPESMTEAEAHIVPGLSHASLISTRKFCDGGCKVVFDAQECRVYYENKLVLTGDRDASTGLWRLPINPTHQATLHNSIQMDLHLLPHQQANHVAFNVYTLPHRQNQLKYMHQSFFNIPIPTLLKAIDNKQLENIPFMKADMIRKYLAKSPATAKGRMKRPRKGLRSTRQKPTTSKGTVNTIPEVHPNAQRTNTHYIPPDEPLDGANNVFCFAALADKQTGTLYTDATGALPVRSLDGYQYYFIAYDYDTNYIFAIPIKDTTDASIINGFEQVFNELNEKGFKPQFNVTDNQAANSIKRYLKTQECQWQFVEPTNHRVNAAKRAIQTYKNHFISGLCSTDPSWPLQLWDQLTTQATITLNLV